ncbi:MAG TPA: hypothetical protein VNF73_03255, partial [Candidatus Saccharimonadales bacterium]|nr:hypothetical protein [Candidatus Saccharimonadales bacterium]
DRPLVLDGESVLAGVPLAELLLDQRLVEVPAPRGRAILRPGDRWTGTIGGRTPLAGRTPLGGRRQMAATGELLFEVGGRWRVAIGEGGGLLEAPAAGIVRGVRAGTGIGLQVAGSGVAGIRAVGAPARGQLEVATSHEGEIRASGLDVGRAGSILVVGSRVDVETLTRARALGIRGIVVAAVASKDLRDFAASEARQRATLHRLPPFALLVIEGALRRPIASPVMSLLSALAGHVVAISGDPPMLVFDAAGLRLPAPPEDWVRVRQGPMAGREGRWDGPGGLRRFRAGVRLEAGLVSFGDDAPVAVPLADLERFV